LIRNLHPHNRNHSRNRLLAAVGYYRYLSVESQRM